jgi:FKBP-type peptidyl-prolyl cis-trans isomerase SlyD
MADDTILNDTVVTLAYTLKVDGQTIDEADRDDPVEYLHGALNIVPGLELALAGHKVGDKLTVTVAPDQGYGEYDPDEVEWFEREEFDDADELAPGMVLAVEDEDGEMYDVTVAEVTAEGVALDFNPPLAGKTLIFHVEVLGVRGADEEEIAHGHPHTVLEFDDEDD